MKLYPNVCYRFVLCILADLYFDFSAGHGFQPFRLSSQCCFFCMKDYYIWSLVFLFECYKFLVCSWIWFSHFRDCLNSWKFCLVNEVKSTFLLKFIFIILKS